MEGRVVLGIGILLVALIIFLVKPAVVDGVHQVERELQSTTQH